MLQISVAEKHCVKQPENANTAGSTSPKPNKFLRVISGAQTLKSAKLTPRRPKNAEVRTREYLTKAEVDSLIKAARETGRQGLRDGLLILMAYRHGLRVSELAGLKWEQVCFAEGLLHVSRAKNGTAATHPIEGDELRLLRQLQRKTDASLFVFLSERRAPLSSRAVQTIVARAGQIAGIPFPVHPHMLRHSTGFALANSGADTRSIQGYLGHKNIQNTVGYTALAPNRFKSFGAMLK